MWYGEFKFYDQNIASSEKVVINIDDRPGPNRKKNILSNTENSLKYIFIIIIADKEL